jgi:tRNA threonylcarbamoyladenosine biosynthesis protein TsaE
MSEFTFLAASEEETLRLGKLLADVLPAGTVVALVGTLGAGKTRLVQAVAGALGVPREEVTSPTFVLVNEYVGGRLPVYHFDAYRLRDEDEFLELGPEEYFDGPGLTFVEWADRVENCLPPDFLRIDIEVTGDTQRRFMISASSRALEPLVNSLRKLLGRV